MSNGENNHLLSTTSNDKNYIPSVGELTLTSPTTVMQGVLYIRTGIIFKTWKPYYCILKKNCLFYKKSQASKRISGFIDLKRTSVWDASNDDGLFLSQKNAFMIYHPLRKTIYLKSDSAFKTKQWIKALVMVRELGRMENEETELYTSSDEEETINFFGKRIRIPFKLPNILKHKGIVKEFVFNDVEKNCAQVLQPRRIASNLEVNEGITTIDVDTSMIDPVSRVSINLCVNGDARNKVIKICQIVEEEFPELTLRVFGIE